LRQLRVYLSSTFEDLKEYRAAVLAELEQAGLDVAQMESYVATDERPVDKCLADVAASDIYVGLFAWRYGYEPPAAHGNPLGRSITELEYRQAETSQLRKLIFFAHPNTKAGWPDRFVDERTGQGDGGAKLARFRAEVGTERLASFFSNPHELAGLVLAAIMRSGKSGRVYNIPPRPPGFVPRPNLTNELVRALAGPGGGAPGRSTVIQGAGGFGKTMLAIDAGHRAEVIAAFPDGLLWTVLGERPDLARVLSDLHGVVTGSPPAVTGTEELGKALGKVLAGRRCLLVVDDAWHADDLSPFLKLVGPVLLITTRVRTLIEQTGQSGWPEVPVDEMDAGEAAGLLGRGMVLDDGMRSMLEPLADQLGNWPLLLDLVNARMLEEQRSRPGQLAACIAKVTKLFELKGVLGFDRRDASSRNAAVARSVEVGLERAEELAPGLAAQASELSVFAEDLAIPVQVLADLWSMDPDLVEEDVLRHLDNLSLVRWNRDSNTVGLHDMIRRAYAARLGDAAPVHARLIGHWGDPFRLPHDFAWQWFAWHCVQAGEEPRLESLLLDLAWVQARLEAATRTVDGLPVADVAAVAHDYGLVSASSAALQVGRALRASAAVLAHHPQALAQQLFGRVGGSDDERLRGLVDACFARTWSDPLVPARPALLPPSAKDVPLVGHEAPVSGALLLANGRRALSWSSEDKTLRLWDLAKGGEPRVLVGHTSKPEGAAVSTDGRHALSWSSDEALLWDLALGTGRELSGERQGFGRRALFVPDGHRVLSWATYEGALQLCHLDQAGEPEVLTQYVLPGSRGALPLPDGSRALSWHADGTLRLWNLRSGDGFDLLPGNAGVVRGATLSPDGRYVLTWSDDRMLRLWGLEGGGPPQVLAGHDDDVRAALVLRGGQGVLSWSDDGRALLWDLTQEGEPKARVWPPQMQAALQADERPGAAAMPEPPEPLPDPFEEGRSVVLTPKGEYPLEDIFADPFGDRAVLHRDHPRGISGALLLPDGRRTLSWTSSLTDFLLWLWDLDGSAEPMPLAGHTAGVTGALLMPDGQRALSWSDDKTLRLWDLAQGIEVQVLSGHEDTIIDAVVSADGRRVLSWAWDKTLRVWDLEDGSALHVLAGHGDRVTGALWTPDRLRVLSWSVDWTLRLWDLTPGGESRVLAQDEHFDGALLLPDGRRALTWWCGSLQVWDLLLGGAPEQLPGGRVFQCSVLPDVQSVLSWGEDGRPRLWVPQPSGKLTATARQDEFEVTDALALPDGRHALCWGRADHALRLVELRQGGETRVLSGHEGQVNGVLMLPDGRRALSWSADKTLRFWDLAQGVELQVLAGHEGEVNGVLMLPDGQRALSWSADKTLRLWDLAQGVALRVLVGHVLGVAGAVVSADGRHVLSWPVSEFAEGKNSALLWDLGEGGEPQMPIDCGQGMYGAQLLPDGRRVLCWSGDRACKLLDLDKGGEPQLLGMEPAGMQGALPLPDGRRGLSWSGEPTLWLWDLEQGSAPAARLDHVGGVDGALVLPDDRFALSWSWESSPDIRLLRWDLEKGQGPLLLPVDEESTAWSLPYIDGKDDIASFMEALVSHVLTWRRDGGVKAISGLDAKIVCFLLRPGTHFLPDGRVLLSLGLTATWPFDPSPLDPDNLVDGALPLPDGQRALSWRDKGLQLWDLQTGRKLHELIGHEGRVRGALLLPDGRRALSWSWDDALRLWDMERPCQLRVLAGHSTSVQGALLMPDGRRVLSWGGTSERSSDLKADLALRLWDLEREAEPRLLPGHTDEINGVSSLPGGGQALSWSDDGTLLLWDLERESASPRELAGHTGPVLGALLLPDGQRVLSWSRDCSLRLWDLRGARQLGCYFSDSVPRAVVLGWGGTRVLVGDELGFVQILAIADEPSNRSRS
jgi:WD40 repeat protein